MEIFTKMRLRPFALLLALLPMLLNAADSQSERTKLMRAIQRLIGRNAPGATGYRATIEFAPNDAGVKVTMKMAEPPGTTRTRTFSMPCDCQFKRKDGLVEVHAAEYWNLGPYEIATATALVDAFTRLNSSAALPLKK